MLFGRASGAAICVLYSDPTGNLHSYNTEWKSDQKVVYLLDLHVQMAMKHSKDYVVPEVEVLELTPKQVLCTSPEDGGHEGIGFEDWQ